MIYPIKDKEGKPKTLYDIEYADLKQLLSFDEGYYVEYKEAFDENVKRKIPKILCSFANSSGGWLFIGVKDDGSVSGIAEERNDFSQTIEQLVSCGVSPTPIYDCSFVRDPNKDGDGVLIVCVREGYEPPYISEGTVYIRSGSSSKPPEDWFERARDSSVLRALEEKRRVAEGKRLEFYRRSIYYPHYAHPDGRPETSFPMFNVYLHRLIQEKRWIGGGEIDEAREAIEGILSTEKGWEKHVLQETPRSIIVRQGKMNSMDNANNVIEIYRNGSVKAHVPLYLLQNSEKDNALGKLRLLVEINNDHLFSAIDAVISFGNALSCAGIVEKILSTHPFCGKREEYLVGYELENCEGISIYSDNPCYAEYVRNKGIPFFAGSGLKLFDERLRDYIELHGEADIVGLVLGFLFEAMGLPDLTVVHEVRRANMKIIFGVDGEGGSEG